MMIGVSTYSYSGLVRAGKMTQLEVVGKVKEMGFDFIEFSVLSVPEGKSLQDFAKEIREECERVGIKALNYAIGADFINGSNGDWQAEVERLKEEVKVASILGVPYMRHDVTRGFPPGYVGQKGFDDVLPVLAKACRAVTEFAAEHGIKTMVENHGFYFQDSERVEKLINAVNHPNFGALVDIGNFLCADEEPHKAVGRMAPYAFHVHVKDFLVKSGMLPAPGNGGSKSRGGNSPRG